MTIARAHLLPFLVLISGACSHNTGSDSGTRNEPLIRSVRNARAMAARDVQSNTAVIYVFRSVGEAERDAETGVPVRDAGTDAVAPDRAAFVEAYNQTVRQLLATTRSSG